MDKNDIKHLMRVFDDIIELTATQGQRVVCDRLQRVRELLYELLEKEEPKPVKIVWNNYGTKLCFCPRCIHNFPHEYHNGVIYCENCGQAVKWE